MDCNNCKVKTKDLFGGECCKCVRNEQHKRIIENGYEKEEERQRDE